MGPSGRLAYIFCRALRPKKNLHRNSQYPRERQRGVQCRPSGATLEIGDGLISHSSQVGELTLGQPSGLSVTDQNFHVGQPTGFVGRRQDPCPTTVGVGEALVLPPDALGVLRTAREELYMKQSDVAQRLGVKPALLGHYETGKRPVPEERLRKWARIVRLSTETADRLRRRSIEMRIASLLADGGMAEASREHIVWMIEHSWTDPDSDFELGANPKGRAG